MIIKLHVNGVRHNVGTEFILVFGENDNLELCSFVEHTCEVSISDCSSGFGTFEFSISFLQEPGTAHGSMELEQGLFRAW